MQRVVKMAVRNGMVKVGFDIPEYVGKRFRALNLLVSGRPSVSAAAALHMWLNMSHDDRARAALMMQQRQPMRVTIEPAEKGAIDDILDEVIRMNELAQAHQKALARSKRGRQPGRR
jgi:hypothetical protein